MIRAGVESLANGVRLATTAAHLERSHICDALNIYSLQAVYYSPDKKPTMVTDASWCVANMLPSQVEHYSTKFQYAKSCLD